MKPRARLAWLWTLVILFLCWLPRKYVPGQERLPPPFILNIDKYIHAGIFVILGFLWMTALQSRRKALWIFLGGVAFAAITELGQENRFVNRDANVADGLADTVGLILGIAAFWIWERFQTQRTPTTPD